MWPPTHRYTRQCRQYMCLRCASVCYLCVSMDLPFCSCRGFYWVSGCCNCNRYFKVAAAAAHVVAVALALAIDAVVVVVCSDHFKKALHTSEGRAQLKFYAHLHLQHMAHARECVSGRVCGWVCLFIGRLALSSLLLLLLLVLLHKLSCCSC